MKTDIILAGVGGQGILSIAAVLGLAAINNNLFLKQSEVHGMSQRGGTVQSHLRISQDRIASDLIPSGGADIILSVEPMESLRYLPYLSRDGWLVTNTKPYINIPDYPGIETILEKIGSLPNNIKINADEIASDIGSPRSSNIVMLGAASPFIQMSLESFEKGISDIFRKKGSEIIDINIKALHAGRKFAENNN